MVPEFASYSRRLKEEHLVALGEGRLNPSAITLDESLPLSAEERLLWEGKLNRNLKDCGCREGAIGLFTGSFIAVGAFLLETSVWASWQVGAAVLLPFIFMAFGRFIGQRTSHQRMRKISKQLLHRIKTKI